MKKKFNINDYKGNYVMPCNTEEKANTFCKYLYSVGRKWDNGDSYLEINEWNKYKKDTCYNFNYGSFCDYNHYCNDYIILEFNDFDWSEKEKENNMKIFTKSDLQNGMVVETKKDIYMVVGDKIINDYGFMALSSYEENLTLTEGDDNFDIVKIYDKITSFNKMNYLLEELRLLWERKDEMETKKYTIKQEYIDEDYKTIEDITILPNSPRGRGYCYSNTNHPIAIMKDGDFALSLTTDSAKEVIKALQEIVSYIEEK